MRTMFELTLLLTHEQTIYTHNGYTQCIHPMYIRTHNVYTLISTCTTMYTHADKHTSLNVSRRDAKPLKTEKHAGLS